jgi:phage shock protein A
MDAASFGTIAASAVALLSPYFQKSAEKFSESVGGAAWEKVVKLYQTVKDKFAGKEAATEALSDLTNSPEDADAQGAVRQQLKKAMADDEEFAKQLASILKEADAAGVDAVFKTNIHGSVKTLIQVINHTGNIEIN